MTRTRINHGRLLRRRCSRSRRSTRWSERCAATSSGTSTFRARTSPSSRLESEPTTVPVPPPRRLLLRHRPTRRSSSSHLPPLPTPPRTRRPTLSRRDPSVRFLHHTRTDQPTGNKSPPRPRYHHHQPRRTTTCERTLRPHRILRRPTRLSPHHRRQMTARRHHPSRSLRRPVRRRKAATNDITRPSHITRSTSERGRLVRSLAPHMRLA